MKGDPIDENKGGSFHVDDFIDDYKQDAYARWMFMHFRLPAGQKLAFAPFIRERKLFCTFEGKRFRVTGASTMGDIWLVRDYNRDHGYDLRVLVADCSAWSSQP